MEKLIISLNGHTSEEIEKVDGVVTSISWDALLPAISELVRLRPYEKIDGFVINDADVRVKISQKRGRKTKSESSLKDAGV